MGYRGLDLASVLNVCEPVPPVCLVVVRCLGRNVVASGRREGTDAHVIAVPTSATDQFIDLTLLSAYMLSAKTSSSLRDDIHVRSTLRK